MLFDYINNHADINSILLFANLHANFMFDFSFLNVRTLLRCNEGNSGDRADKYQCQF